jgi:hypothetical protein
MHENGKNKDHGQMKGALDHGGECTEKCGVE